jgi:hypothetical protein
LRARINIRNKKAAHVHLSSEKLQTGAKRGSQPYTLQERKTKRPDLTIGAQLFSSN